MFPYNFGSLSWFELLNNPLLSRSTRQNTPLLFHKLLEKLVSPVSLYCYKLTLIATFIWTENPFQRAQLSVRAFPSTL